MKPAAFDYQFAENIDHAIGLLKEGNGDSKIKAGGQSLGPMLNLRLAQVSELVDISRIPELNGVVDQGSSILFGACITHAAVEDGQVPDITAGMMASVAAGIAYRAVRNQGTIGGSLAHADPSADWITTLTAAGAEAIIVGPDGERQVGLEKFMESAFETVLAFDEILTAVRVPRFSARARWGYYKFCRKTGEFANAMSAIVVDPERDYCRVVIGATDTRPVVITDANQLLESDDAIHECIIAQGLADDPYSAQMHRAALRRCIEQVRLK